MTIVPVRMYFKDGRVKIAISLAKGKKATTAARPSSVARSIAKPGRPSRNEAGKMRPLACGASGRMLASGIRCVADVLSRRSVARMKNPKVVAGFGVIAVVVLVAGSFWMMRRGGRGVDDRPDRPAAPRQRNASALM